MWLVINKSVPPVLTPGSAPAGDELKWSSGKVEP